MADVLAEKEQVMRKEGILEFVPPDRGADDLGGLDQLKTWVRQRAQLFTAEAQRAGAAASRAGVLLMGMSGCGKSLAVKVIATEWKLPLFRLDMNMVFAGVQGSPEWVFHRALEAVEAVAPAVLWIDEIEMGVAGYHEGETGSLTRIFSTLPHLDAGAPRRRLRRRHRQPHQPAPRRGDPQGALRPGVLRRAAHRGGAQGDPDHPHAPPGAGPRQVRPRAARLGDARAGTARRSSRR